jgi:hypothetical protein
MPQPKSLDPQPRVMRLPPPNRPQGRKPRIRPPRLRQARQNTFAFPAFSSSFGWQIELTLQGIYQAYSGFLGSIHCAPLPG